MSKKHWLLAGMCLLAAAPAVSQRAQNDDRDGRYDRDSRTDRDDRDSRYDRDGRDSRYDRDDREARYDRDDRRDRDDRDDRRGYGRALPGGSWAQSCRRQQIDRGTLRAQCKDQRGKWRDTQINPRQCQTGRVGNRFGSLVCE